MLAGKPPYGHATCALVAIAALAALPPPPPVPAINRAICNRPCMGVNLNQLALLGSKSRPVRRTPPVLLIWSQTVSPHRYSVLSWDNLMIAKLIKGKGFRGALSTILKQGKGVLLETNMAGQTPRSWRENSESFAHFARRWAKAVCHVSLSIHPTEHLTDEQWCEAQRWLSGMASPITICRKPTYEYGASSYSYSCESH